MDEKLLKKLILANIYKNFPETDEKHWRRSVDQARIDENLQNIMSKNKREAYKVIDNGTLPEMIEILGNDQLLVNNIIRLSNSPLFPKTEPIKTLKKAIITIGTEEIKKLLTLSGLGKILQGTKDEIHIMKRIIFNSIFSNILVKNFYESNFKPLKTDGKSCFNYNAHEIGTIGLLHNIGKLILVYQFRDDISKYEDKEYQKTIDELRSEANKYFQHTQEIHKKDLLDKINTAIQEIENKEDAKHISTGQKRFEIKKIVEKIHREKNVKLKEIKEMNDKKIEEEAFNDFYTRFLPDFISKIKSDDPEELTEEKVFNMSHDIYGLLLAIEFNLPVEYQIMNGLHHYLYNQGSDVFLKNKDDVWSLFLRFIEANVKNENNFKYQVFLTISIATLLVLFDDLSTDIFTKLHEDQYQDFGKDLLDGNISLENEKIPEVIENLLQESEIQKYTNQYFLNKIEKNLAFFAKKEPMEINLSSQLLKTVNSSSLVINNKILKKFFSMIIIIVSKGDDTGE